MSPVVIDGYGPKPAMELLGGSASSLPFPSGPFMTGGRSVTMIDAGKFRTISFAEIYRTQPWVGAGVKTAAFAIARLPLQLFHYLDDKGDTRERDRNHPAAALLRRPRPRRTGFHLRWELALSLYTHGNWVGWKKRVAPGAPPAEVWTLDWRLLIPHMLGGVVLLWEWRGKGIPGLATGQLIDPHDVIHVSFSDTGGNDIGVSPLEQLQVTLRSEDALQRYAEANMRNGTRFGMAAILDKSITADRVIRDGVREELEDAHGGLNQAFRPAILGGGIVDLKPLGQQSAVEAELIDQRKVNREEIAAGLGMPAPMIGILDEAKYSSMMELHRMFYVTSLGGPLGLVGESFQAQLIDEEPAWSESDRFMEFFMDEVLKGDAKERWETYAVALDHGGLVLNDVRRKENLKPYDDPRAEEPLIAANNVRPLSSIAAGDTDADQVATSILNLVGKHANRAIDRAARGIGKGEDPTAALDADRVKRELAKDLADVGVDAGELVATTIAELLERDVADLEKAEDVRALTNRYTTTGGAA